jgi:hypothetical protein
MQQESVVAGQGQAQAQAQGQRQQQRDDTSGTGATEAEAEAEVPLADLLRASLEQALLGDVEYDGASEDLFGLGGDAGTGPDTSSAEPGAEQAVGWRSAAQVTYAASSSRPEAPDSGGVEARGVGEDEEPILVLPDSLMWLLEDGY